MNLQVVEKVVVFAARVTGIVDGSRSLVGMKTVMVAVKRAISHCGSYSNFGSSSKGSSFVVRFFLFVGNPSASNL